MTATGLEPTTTYFANDHSTIYPNRPNDWAVLWVLICTMHLTVCFYHVTNVFQSESALYSCLNLKELLAQSRREIWGLSGCSCTRTHNNHLVRKRTLNRLAKLAKWLSCVVSTYLYGALDGMFLWVWIFRVWILRVWIHSEKRTWHDKNIQSF